MESRSHKIAANRIAKHHKAEYNKGQGPDINIPKMAIEVETETTVKDGIRQLQGLACFRVT